MSESRLRERFFDTDGLTLQEAEAFGTDFAQMQRDIMFWIADLANYAQSKWPDTNNQIWPEWVSPGLIQRAAGVGRAYPAEQDRRHAATYSQYMQAARKPDRHELLDKIVSEGQTTDESRKSLLETHSAKQRWLLAVDVHFHAHRHFFSGAGVETAVRVTEWLKRLVGRLKEKGLTDAVCCFDSLRNARKELTKDWEDKYKDRPQKDQVLVQQLQLVQELLNGAGFRCVSVDGFESDDLMASYANQFPGRVTLLTADKDARQCLSDKCNILLDVEWIEDDTSGDAVPNYKWLSAKQHTEDTGLRPDQWAAFQTIAGDSCDGVKGALGIGEKGATDLVREFGTLEAVLEAAKAGDERIKEKKRTALIQLAERVDVVRQLVTLRNDLAVPMDTRLMNGDC